MSCSSLVEFKDGCSFGAMDTRSPFDEFPFFFFSLFFSVLSSTIVGEGITGRRFPLDVWKEGSVAMGRLGSFVDMTLFC